MSNEIVKTSKFLSLVLRHKPEVIGLELDNNGWAEVDELIRRARADGRRLDRPLLERIVSENDKQRFAFSDDGSRIRANQGHSVEIDLDLPPVVPPEILYHGTAYHFLKSIRAGGLVAGSRRHVHLSADASTAARVGRRHGKPTVLRVRSAAMAEAGFQFFLSANGVWLAERVPAEYIDFDRS